MALNESRPRTTFLSIMGGKIVQTFKTETPGAKTRVVGKGKNKGQTVWDKQYGSITGLIKDIHVSENEWGKQWNVELFCEDGEPGNQNFTLNMPYSSKPSKYFLLAVKNVDVTKRVEFTPWESSKLVDGATVVSTSLYIKNEGQKESAKWFYTKEDPQGMPGLKEVMVNGKKTWDSTDQLAFFEKMVATDILPKIKPMDAHAIVDETEPGDEF